MSRSLGLTPEIITYLAAKNRPEAPALARCRAETAALGDVARMQISAEQGAFLDLLLRLIGARRAVEVGVFTGYSALATALALQDIAGAEARLLACDISEEWAARARDYWREAGVEAIVDLRIGPAGATLAAEIAQGGAGSYDFAFIDADKTGYDLYYDQGLALLRPGGLMAFDNVLWSGAVADPSDLSADTAALRAVADKARADPRVDSAICAIGDGLLLVRKK